MEKETVVGILVDNYKLSKFKSTLKKNGFSNIQTENFNKDITVLKIKCDLMNVGLVKKICEDLELYFKALKN